MQLSWEAGAETHRPSALAEGIRACTLAAEVGPQS